MTEPAAPHGTTSTLPPPSANGSAPPPPAPPPPGREQLQTRTSGMRTGLIAGFAALVVAVIFIIQNAHAANISFLGVHLVLPLAAALLLAAITGALAMAAAGPARVTQLRQIIRRALRKARAGEAAHDDRLPADPPAGAAPADDSPGKGEPPMSTARKFAPGSVRESAAGGIAWPGMICVSASRSAMMTAQSPRPR